MDLGTAHNATGFSCTTQAFLSCSSLPMTLSRDLRGGLYGSSRRDRLRFVAFSDVGCYSMRGAGDHALFFLKAPHHLSSASRRGARYASGVPTPSRKERVRSQSTWPSVSSPLHALFRSPGSAARS